MVGLVEALKCLNGEYVTYKTFGNIGDCLPYLAIISILKSNKETLETMFPSRPCLKVFGEFLFYADTSSPWRNKTDADLIRQMRVLEALYQACLIRDVSILVDARSSKLIFENLKLRGDTELNGIDFSGIEGGDQLLISEIPFKEMIQISNVPLQKKMLKDGRLIARVQFANAKLTGGVGWCNFLIENGVKKLILRNVSLDLASLRANVNCGRLFSETSIEEFIYQGNSFDTAYFYVPHLPKSIEKIFLEFDDDASLDRQLEIIQSALKHLPNMVQLNLRRRAYWNGGDTKLDLKTVICIILHRCVKSFNFCDHILYSSIKNEKSKEDWLKQTIGDENVDEKPKPLANVIMAAEPYSKVLNNPLDNLDLVMHTVTVVKSFRGVIDDADIDTATKTFRSILEGKYGAFKADHDQLGDIVKTNNDFRRLFSEAYLGLMSKIVESSEARLKRQLNAAQPQKKPNEDKK